MGEETNSFSCPTAFPLFPNLSLLQQNAVVVASAIFIAVSTWALLRFYDYMVGKKYWDMWLRLWPLLGIVPYVLVGVTGHFGEMGQRNACIVPPNGTWGWWWLPVSPGFMVIITGYGEIIGGLLLAVSGLLLPLSHVQEAFCRLSSLFLFYMTVGMTFANCYTLTHGTFLYEIKEPMSGAVHLARYFVQAIWLSCLLYMAKNKHRKAIDDAGKEKKSK